MNMLLFQKRGIKMERIKTVSISSRRSSKVGNEFLTFEMTLEADVNNLSDEEKKEYIRKMWDYAGEEVDNQIRETVNSIQ